MKYYAIAGAYEEYGTLIPTIEGVYKTKKEAQEALEKLFKEAEENCGFIDEEDLESGICKNRCSVYYKDDSHQEWEIISFEI